MELPSPWTEELVAELCRTYQRASIYDPDSVVVALDTDVGLAKDFLSAVNVDLPDPESKCTVVQSGDEPLYILAFPRATVYSIFAGERAFGEQPELERSTAEPAPQGSFRAVFFVDDWPGIFRIDIKQAESPSGLPEV